MAGPPNNPERREAIRENQARENQIRNGHTRECDSCTRPEVREKIAAKETVTPSETRIVEYQTTLTTGVPKLKGAVLAIDLHGSLAAEIKKVLMKHHGVRKFAEGTHPCHLPGQALVCLSIAPPSRRSFSGSGSSSFSSGSGSFSESASQSGDYYIVQVVVTLIKADGTSIELGVAASYAFAGSSSGSFSSSTSLFSASSSGNSTTPREAAIGSAIRKASLKMLGSKWRALDGTTRVEWFPGADAAVAAAFK